MPEPALPGDLAQRATYKGVSFVLEHPDEGMSPVNPPAAAYHWWKAPGPGDTEVYIVSQARLEDVMNSTQEGPGTPIAAVTYYIDSRIRSGVSATSETPIIEWDADAQQLRLWSGNDEARLVLDALARRRAELASTGSITLSDSEQVAIREETINAWPDASERAALVAMRDGGAAVEPDLMQNFMAAFTAKAAECGETTRTDLVLRGSDRMKAARRAIVTSKDVTLADVTNMMTAKSVHVPQRETGQYL